MDYTRRTKGVIGELKVQQYFIEHGYEVYKSISDNSTFDILVALNGKVSKVSVKYTSVKTSSGRWKVELRSISRRNNGAVNVKYFDNLDIDILAVYIAPEDRVVLMAGKAIQEKTALTVL